MLIRKLKIGCVLIYLMLSMTIQAADLLAKRLQYDPLSLVFQTPPPATPLQQFLHKSFIIHNRESQELVASCNEVGKADYATPAAEVQARRSVIGALQYLGLELSGQAIGQYARELQMTPDSYAQLTRQLLVSSCSSNVSVFGQKLLQQQLAAAFVRSDLVAPSFPGMPLASPKLVAKTSLLMSKELELHHTLQVFRALCSWGADTAHYRLLPPLLANPSVMSAVFRHMRGLRFKWDNTTHEVRPQESDEAVQVSCQGVICRRVTNATFKKEFPRTLGSSGLKEDLQRLWCHHFRWQELRADDPHPQVREWIKQLAPEQERQMTGQLVALLTGVPDLMVMAKSYAEVAETLRTSVEERWDRWAKSALLVFSQDLLFEESLEIKLRPQRSADYLPKRLFGIELDVTMGELDRLFSTGEKFSLSLELRLSRNWLRWLRSRWSVVNQAADPALMEAFMGQVANQLGPQIESKKKYFSTPLFNNEGLEDLLAQELVSQVTSYSGPLFDTFEERMITVPVRFNYGLFALSYIRYKAQIKSQHKTLDI